MCLAAHLGMSPDGFPHWTQVVFKLEKWEHLSMLTWVSRKVRKLAIIISFSLMRCLLSLPKVISCPRKSIIWPDLGVILMELEENSNLRGGGREGEGDVSLLQFKAMSEDTMDPSILSHRFDTVELVIYWPRACKKKSYTLSVWQVCVTCLSFRKKWGFNSRHSSAPMIPPHKRAWPAVKHYMCQGNLLELVSSTALKSREFNRLSFCSI